MTWYLYQPQVARDGDTSAVARSGVGRAFAPTDFSGTSALSAYSTSGLLLDSLLVGGDGMVQAFMLEDTPECLWISGTYKVPLVSFTGLFADASAARIASDASALAAANAAALAADSAFPTGGSDGDVVTRSSSAPGGKVWAAPTGGAGGGGGGTATPDWSNIQNKPPTFPSAPHNTDVSTLFRSASPAPVQISQFLIDFLSATTLATARQKIGAGTGDGTSNVFIGAGGAAAFNHTHGTLYTTPADVDTKIAAAGIGAGGNGLGNVFRIDYTSGAYAPRSTAPAGAKVDWKGPTPPPVNSTYAQAGDGYIPTT